MPWTHLRSFVTRMNLNQSCFSQLLWYVSNYSHWNVCEKFFTATKTYFSSTLLYYYGCCLLVQTRIRWCASSICVQHTQKYPTHSHTQLAFRSAKNALNDIKSQIRQLLAIQQENTTNYDAAVTAGEEFEGNLVVYLNRTAEHFDCRRSVEVFVIPFSDFRLYALPHSSTMNPSDRFVLQLRCCEIWSLKYTPPWIWFITWAYADTIHTVIHFTFVFFSFLRSLTYTFISYAIYNTQEVCNQIWATLYDYPSLKHCDGLRNYAKDCVRLAWSMSTQNPPLVIEYETRTFRSDMHVRFHSSDQDSTQVKTYLWPALLEGHSQGSCIHRGVVITWSIAISVQLVKVPISNLFISPADSS